VDAQQKHIEKNVIKLVCLG